MSRKPKTPKVRHVWGINPKTRVAPNKKETRTSCPHCEGSGLWFRMCEVDGSFIDCQMCGGTGYAN